MLKKIFKTILVLSICVGISLPTNAAVSVSDGSAFVTKAEFAADLNNLSNRMAQLENSLDAKIDSLVSSYLTRNGIWNGAKQDVIKTPQIYEPFNITFSGGKSNGTHKYGKNIFVDSITKSGMYSGYYGYTDPNANGTQKGYFRWGWYGTMSSNQSGRTILGANTVFIITDQNNETKFSSVIFDLIGGVDNTVNGYSAGLFASIPWSVVLIPFQFFVSKGDRLSWEVECPYHLTGVGSLSVDTGSYNAFKIWLEDGYVY